MEKTIETAISGVDVRECLKEVMREGMQTVFRLEKLKSQPTLTPREVAELYNIPETSLRTWRSRGGGPDYEQPYKNGPVWYTHEAIQKFQRNSRIKGSNK